jgi:hypothetical protein
MSTNETNTQESETFEKELEKILQLQTLISNVSTDKCKCTQNKKYFV